eukprot:snap_masked-scaffold_3-processed-gene-2.40-mRNA-1 protein AED:1.00 eAED:1.00 QI:0/-1/0/0/-1/1/1/0/569
MSSDNNETPTVPSGGQEAPSDEIAGQSEPDQGQNQSQDEIPQNPSTPSNSNPLANAAENAPAERSRSSRSSPDPDLLDTNALERLRITQRERRAMDRAEKLFEERLASLREKEADIKRQEDRLNKWAQDLAEKEASGLERQNSPSNKSTSKASQNTFNTAQTAEQKVEEVKDENPEERSKKNTEDASLTTLSVGLDNWSETASTYVDASQRNKPFQREIPPKEVQVVESSGLPYVKFAAPEKIQELTYQAIAAFVHDFTNLKANVPSLNACGLLAKEVADILQLRGVDIRDSNAIMRYFVRHLQQFEKLEKKRTLKNLKTKLNWEVGSKNPIEQIYHFFDEVLKLLKYLSKEEQRSHQKKILKIILQKVPKKFEVDYDELMMCGKNISIKELKSILLKRWFVLEEGENKEGEKIERRMNKNKKDKRPQRNKQAPMIAYRINVRRVGNDARNITLLAFDINKKEYVQVPGLADTGADRNVSSLKAMERYKIKEEDPLFVKEVEFPDKSVKKVAKVITAKIKLTQGDDELDLGVQRFFCINSENWDELIIGEKTLKRFNVGLNLKDATRRK